MKKQSIVGIVLLALLCGGYVTAHDCALVTNANMDVSQTDAFKNFTTNISNQINIEGVLPAEAMSRALINLKKACCAGQDMSNKDQYCKGYQDKQKFPNSEYLYDQLLDVQLRRLDGNPDLAYGVTVDPMGKERRDFINKAADTQDGTQAKTILDTYTTYRTRKDIYVDDRTTAQYQNAIEQYKDSTLADKYFNMCNIISSTLQIGRKISVDDSVQAKCQALVNKRISDEASYTKLIMIKKSNELLHNSIQAYAQQYFVQDKIMTLLTLVNKIKSLFSTMVQQAAVSKTCSS